MVAYRTAGGEEAGYGPAGAPPADRKWSSDWMWRVSGALLLLAALCLAALFFTWHFAGRPDAANQNQAGQSQAQSSSATTGPHSTLSRIGSGAKAAIHLEAGDDDGAGAGPELQWRKDQGQAFDQGGFRLTNNSIVVPRSGLYFVYSQASFRASCDAAGAAAPLSHRVWRYSDSVGRRASLMSAVRSACQSQEAPDAFSDGRGWYNAVYLGAVFQLQRGDRLWTETSPLAQLETDEGRTFFGVFAL